MKVYELLAAFSLLGELGEEEEDDEVGEKFIPDNPGGSVAVFCPLRLFLHTGHVSCCRRENNTHYHNFESCFRWQIIMGCHRLAVIQQFSLNSKNIPLLWFIIICVLFVLLCFNSCNM